MIVVEKICDRYKTYSNEGYTIRPVYDRMGKPLRTRANYVVAYDREINGQPRFDYEETDEKIKSYVHDNQEGEQN